MNEPERSVQLKLYALTESQILALIELAIERFAAKQPSEQPKGLLTVDQAAERLGVSSGTVRSLVGCGKLPASRIGKGRGTLRFDPADLKTLQKESAGSNPALGRARRFVR